MKKNSGCRPRTGLRGRLSRLGAGATARWRAICQPVGILRSPPTHRVPTDPAARLKIRGWPGGWAGPRTPCQGLTRSARGRDLDGLREGQARGPLQDPRPGPALSAALRSRPPRPCGPRPRPPAPRTGIECANSTACAFRLLYRPSLPIVRGANCGRLREGGPGARVQRALHRDTPSLRCETRTRREGEEARTLRLATHWQVGTRTIAVLLCCPSSYPTY